MKLKIFLIIIFVLLVVLFFIPARLHYEAPILIEPVVNKAEAVEAIVTMYTSEVGQTDDTPFITASGESVGPGTIACPSRLAFGTRVEIENEEYVCKDRMAKRYRDTNHFDIWHEDVKVAINFGRQKTEVIILD